jgi:hypothetical protein
MVGEQARYVKRAELLPRTQETSGVGGCGKGQSEQRFLLEFMGLGGTRGRASTGGTLHRTHLEIARLGDALQAREAISSFGSG